MKRLLLLNLIIRIILKKDIREIGSGNIGATNVLRTGNKMIGYITLSLDILKAIIPLLIIKFNHPEFLFISALSIFLGHVFPLWLKFKGGKGVATYLGIIFCLNYFLGLVFIFVWFLIFPYFAGEKIGQLYLESYTPIAIFSMILISLCILSSAYFTKDRIPYLKQPSKNESRIKITDSVDQDSLFVGNEIPGEARDQVQ